MAETRTKKDITEWGGIGGGGGKLPRGGGGEFNPMEVRGRGATPPPRAYIKGESEPTAPRTSSTDRAMGQVEQSIRDAGGYPTREGKPMMTKMQQRMEARKASQNFRKGGMVPGRDYSK